jgi:hypothetical protein
MASTAQAQPPVAPKNAIEGFEGIVIFFVDDVANAINRTDVLYAQRPALK